MTVFWAIRSVCCLRVNDATGSYPPKTGKRARYVWVCAKKKCRFLCCENTCPVMKKLRKDKP